MSLHNWRLDDNYQFGDLMDPGYEEPNEGGLSMSECFQLTAWLCEPISMFGVGVIWIHTLCSRSSFSYNKSDGFYRRK